MNIVRAIDGASYIVGVEDALKVTSLAVFNEQLVDPLLGVPKSTSIIIGHHGNVLRDDELPVRGIPDDGQENSLERAKANVVFVYDRRHLEMDPEALVSHFHLNGSGLVQIPGAEATLAELQAKSSEHLELQQSLCESLEYQFEAIHVALRNLMSHVSETESVFNTIAENVSEKLATYEHLIAIVEPAMDTIARIPVAEELMGQSSDRVRYLGSYVSKDKMRLVRDSCVRNLNDLTSRFSALQGTMVDLGESVVSVQDDVERTNMDHFDLLKEEAQNMHSRMLALQDVDAALFLDEEARSHVLHLVEKKNVVTCFVVYTLQHISTLQSASTALMKDLELWTDEFQSRMDNFKHLARLESMTLAYVAALNEIARRKAYLKNLSLHTSKFREIADDFVNTENEKRTQWKSTYDGKLPWEIPGLAKNTGDSTQLVQSLGQDITDEYPKISINTLKRVSKDLAAAAVGLPDQSIIAQAQEQLATYITDLASLESKVSEEVSQAPQDLQLQSRIALLEAELQRSKEQHQSHVEKSDKRLADLKAALDAAEHNTSEAQKRQGEAEEREQKAEERCRNAESEALDAGARARDVARRAELEASFAQESKQRELTSVYMDLAAVKSRLTTLTQEYDKSLEREAQLKKDSSLSEEEAARTAPRIVAFLLNLMEQSALSSKSVSGASSHEGSTASQLPQIFEKAREKLETLDQGTPQTQDVASILDTIQPKDLLSPLRHRISRLNAVIKKWQLDTQGSPDKSKLLPTGPPKISFRDFSVGDLALFLPTRNSVAQVWAAFNVGCPHHFLQSTGQIAEQIKSREWIVARITAISEFTVSSEGSEQNPFQLSLGTRYFLLQVEPWSSRPSGSQRRSRIASGSKREQKSGAKSMTLSEFKDKAALSQAHPNVSADTMASDVSFERNFASDSAAPGTVLGGLNESVVEHITQDPQDAQARDASADPSPFLQTPETITEAKNEMSKIFAGFKSPKLNSAAALSNDRSFSVNPGRRLGHENSASTLSSSPRSVSSVTVPAEPALAVPQKIGLQGVPGRRFPGLVSELDPHKSTTTAAHMLRKLNTSKQV